MRVYCNVDVEQANQINDWGRFDESIGLTFITVSWLV